MQAQALVLLILSLYVRVRFTFRSDSGLTVLDSHQYVNKEVSFERPPFSVRLSSAKSGKYPIYQFTLFQSGVFQTFGTRTFIFSRHSSRIQVVNTICQCGNKAVLMNIYSKLSRTSSTSFVNPSWSAVHSLKTSVLEQSFRPTLPDCFHWALNIVDDKIQIIESPLNIAFNYEADNYEIGITV